MDTTNNTPGPSLEGRILVADSSLQDPHFAQSLVFIAKHSREGAMGVILNRPTGRLLAQAAGAQALPGGAENIPLLVGGPVNPGFLAVGVFRQGPTDRDWSASFSEEPAEIARLAGNPDPFVQVRAFLGYAGWEEGQLERELREGSWKVADPSRALFHPPWLEGLWFCYNSAGEAWRDLLDYLPDDPRLN